MHEKQMSASQPLVFLLHVLYYNTYFAMRQKMRKRYLSNAQKHITLGLRKYVNGEIGWQGRKCKREQEQMPKKERLWRPQIGP
jgi:hypothetical protein